MSETSEHHSQLRGDKMNPKRDIAESQRHDERLHDLGDINRIASVAASMDGRRMNGWVDG